MYTLYYYICETEAVNREGLRRLLDGNEKGATLPPRLKLFLSGGDL